MFSIIVDGQVKGLCEKPNYVKKKNNIWINGNINDYEAIAIGGVAYENAIAKEENSGEYLFQANNQIAENIISIEDIQDALVELADLIVSKGEE